VSLLTCLLLASCSDDGEPAATTAPSTSTGDSPSSTVGTVPTTDDDADPMPSPAPPPAGDLADLWTEERMCGLVSGDEISEAMGGGEFDDASYSAIGPTISCVFQDGLDQVIVQVDGLRLAAESATLEEGAIAGLDIFVDVENLDFAGATISVDLGDGEPYLAVTAPTEDAARALAALAVSRVGG
jgi:hypothetical protein